MQRISEYKQSQSNAPNWVAKFWASSARDYVDSVIQRIAFTVTKEVIGGWSKVFKRSSGAKSISIDWNIDPDLGDLPYISFYVSDGADRYKLSERSLGFRWFFSFLLFTAFRKSLDRPTLFLFDEPAANLHAKAQAELLTSFKRITEGNNQIIYSTHSHHMINPRWLSSAYIVENASIDLESDNSFAMSTSPTRILATKYRDFAAQNPSRVEYFQPVLEKLEYVAPEVVGRSPFILIEGITDFYALRYTKDISCESDDDFSLMPGTGSGSSGPLISYLIGRGEKFVVLLDDDASGRKEAIRYKDNWYLSSQVVFTVGELVPALQGRKLESLIDAESYEIAQKHLRLTSKPSKKQIGNYFAECCALKSTDAISNATLQTLRSVLVASKERVNSL